VKHIYYAFRKALTLFLVSKGQHRELDLQRSLLAAVEDSIGSKQFRQLFRLDGEDVLNNGMYSCAWYVSNILAGLRLIGSTHGTVESTVKDLKNSGWVEDGFSHLAPGTVFVWEEVQFPEDDRPHKHIGFYTGNNSAVSMNYKDGIPLKHHATFEETRKIQNVFWNPDFDR